MWGAGLSNPNAESLSWGGMCVRVRLSFLNTESLSCVHSYPGQAQQILAELVEETQLSFN